MFWATTPRVYKGKLFTWVILHLYNQPFTIHEKYFPFTIHEKYFKAFTIHNSSGFIFSSHDKNGLSHFMGITKAIFMSNIGLSQFTINILIISQFTAIKKL